MFLQNTANIFQPGPRQVPNVLPVNKSDEPAQPVLSIQKEMPPDDLDSFEKEPPTPTNCEPPAEAKAIIESPEFAAPSDSGSAKTNGNIANEVTSSDSESKESEEESHQDATSDFETDSEADSSESPFEALNQYVALPSVVVEEDEEPAVKPVVILREVQEVNESTDDAPPIPPPPHHPKLAMQEDFDLSPSSEKIDLPEKLTAWARSLSKESVDSSKFALTETEFSDWADNSLGGDLDAELNIDPEPVKQQMGVKENARPSEIHVAKPAVTVNNGATNFDDIEYADDSEERVVDFKGYTNLIEETPSPEKPSTPIIVIAFVKCYMFTCHLHSRFVGRRITGSS